MSASALVSRARNVAGSQGLVKKTLQHLLPHGDELGLAQPDPIFHVGSETVNQVTARNSPSVINAVFNQRQFWDGRASPIFIGVSPCGVRAAPAGGSGVRRSLRSKGRGLSWGDRAVVLPASLTGKSTLAAALSCRGWRLLSDELTLIRFGGSRVLPLASSRRSPPARELGLGRPLW